MIKQVEIRGLWWLPSKSDEKIAGVLNYMPSESIALELIGSFYDFIELFEKQERNEQIIWGESSDGKAVTLFNCSQSISHNSKCSFSMMRLRVQHVIIGTHINSLDEPCIEKAFLFFDELSYWYNPQIINFHINKDNMTWDKITNDNDDSQSVSTKINDLTYTLKPEALFRYNPYSQSIEVRHETNLIITSTKPFSFNDILFQNSLFEQFFSLATLSQVQCKRIIAKHPEQSSSLEILHNDFRKEYSPMTKKDHFLFQYADIESDYDTILSKWFENIPEVYPIRTHLISSLGNITVFNSATFLSIVQALEGFYYRFIMPEASLKCILEYFNEQFRTVGKAYLEPDDISEIVDSRHYYSHLLPDGKKKHVVQGIELYKHFKKLRIMLICCILNMIGLTNDEIESIIENSNNPVCMP